MTLPLEVAPTIVGKGAWSINFYVPDSDNPDDVQTSELSVQIKYSDGRVVVRSFDFLLRLTDDNEGTNTHLPALAAIKTYTDNRIDTEILGL